jgi:hypothetical protein
MEPVWLEEKQEEIIRIDNWAKKWALDSARRLPFTVEIVRERQMRRETSYEIVLIAVGIGILGNMFAQSLFPVLSVPLLVVSSAGICILIVGFLLLKDRFAPMIPARFWTNLDFSTLMEASDSDEWFALKYLVGGVGFKLEDFEEYAGKVLRLTIQSYGIIALGTKNLTPQITTKRSTPKFGLPYSKIVATTDLSQASDELGFLGVHSTLVMEMYSSTIGAEGRVHGFDLITRVDIANPANPASDDFLEETVGPSMVQLAASYAQEAWTQLLTRIDNVVGLHRLLIAMSDYMKRHGVPDPWFLMDYYPYDGQSDVMFVIDKYFLDRGEVRNQSDILTRAIEQNGFFGSYVTDCDQWSVPNDHQSRGELYPRWRPHLQEELMYVHPRFVVTIGSRAKDFAEQYKSQKQDFQIVALLADTQCGQDRSSFEKKLEEAFKAVSNTIRTQSHSTP